MDGIEGTTKVGWRIELHGRFVTTKGRNMSVGSAEKT